jgi:hypothetical protein
MRSRFRLILVAIALIAGVLLVVVIAGGDDDPPPAKPVVAAKGMAPVGDLRLEAEGLIYNVTDVRVLDFDDPLAAPYLTNLHKIKGTDYLGVFMRVYNPTGKDLASASGYLLEPSKQPGLAEQNNATESPFSLVMGATVKAKNMLPEPGSAAAKGTIPGALILYPISKETTDNQPFDLVVHTPKGALAKLRLPTVHR